jgi:hypothetical protein
MCEEEEGNRRERNRALRMKEDLRKVLSLPEGKRFISEVIRSLYDGPYTGDAMSTAYNCGIASVARELFERVIEINPQVASELIITINND